MATTARSRFKQILTRTTCTPAAPIFDPLSARIADLVGYEISKLSGSVGKFANLAVPDGIPVANMSDLADVCARITRITDACLIVDADEGGGNALTIMRTVRDLESAGVCAIEIEDNLVPSRFPEPATSGQKTPSRHADIVSAAEQVGKLKAAVAARRDPETVIVARTSALDELSLPDALDRIRAYSGTGVEALMFPNLPNGRASIEAISKATTLPLFLLRMPADAVADAAFLAANRVLIRYVEQSPYAMAVKAIHDGLKHLKDGGAPAELKPRQASAELLRAVDRTEEFGKWQQEYLKD